MKFKIRATFQFDHPEDDRTIEWYEEGAVKKIGDNEVPMDLDEIKVQYRKLFVTYMQNDRPFSVEMTNGGLAFVDLTKTAFITVFAEEVREGGK
jgi:hypothetical protein